MGRVGSDEAARVITSLVIRGESCDTCRHNNLSYGSCPYEPDARDQKPVVSGTLFVTDIQMDL